ncbi:MAG: transglutaminase family protein [Anaerovoracaceae bacterium]
MKKGLFRRLTAFALCGTLTAVSLAGCGGSVSSDAEITSEADALAVYQDSGVVMDIDEEAIPMGGAAAAVSTTLMPQASGTVTQGNSKVTIDASNTKDGYIMVKYLAQTNKKLKLIVKGPSGTGYTYNINKIGSYETFPLSDGSGSYTVGVYENISGTSYSTVFSTTISVQLLDQFAPFLLPNQYVNYTADSQVVKKAAELTAGKATDLDKISAVYQWVITNLTYDKQLAATVQSGYLPDLDKVLSVKKGICFDYASLMTAMLRSQGIPCKLVVGYSGSAYHAWINAYTNEGGWVNSVIYFDGTTWKLMDPTFASTGRQSDAIMKYIGDGANYQAKYLY